jgi:hypothetical protein
LVTLLHLSGASTVLKILIKACLGLPTFQLSTSWQWIGLLKSIDETNENHWQGDITFPSYRLSSIHRMNGTYPIEEPEITALADHTPTSMTVPVEDIRAGFYRKLYAGQHDTWYTGYAFCSDYSSLLWAYTDTIVDRMMAWFSWCFCFGQSGRRWDTAAAMTPPMRGCA